MVLCLGAWAPLSAQPISESQREGWLDYFRSQAVDLKQKADLAPVLAQAENRQLVLLGESTHGTHEYYAWRAKISRWLIQEAGYRFLAVEGDWEAIDALNRYVKHFPSAGENARTILLDFERWPQWMWANEEFAELAEWIREWNADLEPEKRVGIHGIDVYGWGDSVEQLPVYLESLRENWGAEAREALEALNAMEGDMFQFQRRAILGRVSTEDEVEAILHALREGEDTFRKDNPKSFLLAKQSTGLIRQAKRHMRGSVHGGAASWNPRAENFMDTVERLLAHYGDDARGVVWAHNTHIGDGRHTPMAEQGMVNIGQLARERLGAETCLIIGFTSYRGEVMAGREWGARREVMTKPTARDGSFDAWLREALAQRESAVFIPLEQSRADPVLRRFGMQRAIGVTYNPEQDFRANYVPTVLPLRYDALIFFYETRALKPLHP